MGVALLTKKSTLHPFEKITKEMDEIRRAKMGEKNNLAYDQLL